MDIAGGEEGVDAGALRFRQGGGGAFDIAFAGAGEGGDLDPGEFAADGVDGVEISL